MLHLSKRQKSLSPNHAKLLIMAQSPWVSDLSPLKGIQLTHLEVNGTPVNDFSPLRGMGLTYLKCPLTPVADLSPLEDMPLELLWLPKSVSTENLQSIRGIHSLKQINGMPAAEFWKKVDAPE